MNKFSKIGVLVFFLFMFAGVYSQRRPVQEKIKTLKVAFITERLSLSSSEAQAFWPIYNEHEANLEALKREERIEIRSKMMDFESLSEREAASLLQQSIALEKEKHQMNIRFLEQMSEVISAKKTFLLIKAEEDFKKRLLREIQQRRRGQ
ncbi:MAG: hypothetical protein KJO94_02120 [Eudoraea sp.]|nr:hypothetical protein [Eudoraea sp.]